MQISFSLEELKVIVEQWIQRPSVMMQTTVDRIFFIKGFHGFTGTFRYTEYIYSRCSLHYVLSEG